MGGNPITWCRDSGGNGVLTSVVFSDAVTPVARKKLLGAWTCSSSEIG